MIILVLCYILPMELHIHWNTMGIQTWEQEQDIKTGQGRNGLVKQRRQRDEVHDELDPKFEEE